MAPFDSQFGRIAVVRAPQGETFSIISVEQGQQAEAEESAPVSEQAGAEAAPAPPGGRPDGRRGLNPRRRRRAGGRAEGGGRRSGRIGAMASLANASPPIALGALDGRYRAAVAPLVDHLSEAALNRERVRVEVEWLIHLTEHAASCRACAASPPTSRPGCAQVVEDFGADEVAELAEIERETVHDVKAVEYFLKRRLPTHRRRRTSDLAELVHFGCTSEDINNLSYALMVRGAVTEVWLPRATALVDAIADMARDLRDVPLLAHTHGQPATPTTMGKELAVLAARLRRQLRRDRRRGVPRQAQRRDRHVRRAPRRGARRRLAAASAARSSRASA